jgi:hypothetical protein
VLTHRERLRFDSGGQPFVPTSERNERGPLLGTLALDFGNDFLPRLSDASIGFDPDQRFKVDWTIAAPAPSVDGGTALASWFREFLTFQWVLVFPPGTSLLAPPNPGGDGDLFWPNPDAGDNVSLNQLRLDDATFLPSYGAYRQSVLGVTRPPMAPYVLRSTQLAPVP